MPCITNEVSTFNLEIFEFIFLAFNITQLNFNDNSGNNNENNIQIGENIMVEQNNNYFQLYDDFEEDMDDETAKNSDLNPWRKDYYEFLDNRISNSEFNE